MNIEQVALVCHETNRAYCEMLGDTSQLPWDHAPEWQRQSAIKGVRFALANPDAGPSASHDSWLKEKAETGWAYGPTKDAEKKLHPCFVPYEQLPPEQRLKDSLFIGIVRAFAAQYPLSWTLGSDGLAYDLHEAIPG